MPPRARDEQQEREEEDITIPSAPTTIDPYTILSVPQDATPEQIKTAYRKAALKHHPDKAPEESKAAAHTKFQEIAFAYAILSDERRRKRYDVTGRTEESLDLDDDTFDWVSYYREQYKDVVTAEVIESSRSKFWRRPLCPDPFQNISYVQQFLRHLTSFHHPDDHSVGQTKQGSTSTSSGNAHAMSTQRYIQTVG